MDVVHRRALPPPRSSSPPSSASGLNPNAPLFVPMAYRSVEDFSDQWWQLVDSSAWFRDYWFRQQQNQQQHQQLRRRSGDLLEEEEGDKERRRDFEAVLLADEDSLFHGYQPAEEESKYARDVAASQGGRWNVPLGTVEERRMLLEKATQMASARNSPWALQRPI